jgi:hypothetical protein
MKEPFGTFFKELNTDKLCTLAVILGKMSKIFLALKNLICFTCISRFHWGLWNTNNIRLLLMQWCFLLCFNFPTMWAKDNYYLLSVWMFFLSVIYLSLKTYSWRESFMHNFDFLFCKPLLIFLHLCRTELPARSFIPLINVREFKWNFQRELLKLPWWLKSIKIIGFPFHLGRRELIMRKIMFKTHSPSSMLASEVSVPVTWHLCEGREGNRHNWRIGTGEHTVSIIAPIGCPS